MALGGGGEGGDRHTRLAVRSPAWAACSSTRKIRKNSRPRFHLKPRTLARVRSAMVPESQLSPDEAVVRRRILKIGRISVTYNRVKRMRDPRTRTLWSTMTLPTRSWPESFPPSSSVWACTCSAGGLACVSPEAFPPLEHRELFQLESETSIFYLITKNIV